MIIQSLTFILVPNENKHDNIACTRFWIFYYFYFKLKSCRYLIHIGIGPQPIHIALRVANMPYSITF